MIFQKFESVFQNFQIKKEKYIKKKIKVTKLFLCVFSNSFLRKNIFKYLIYYKNIKN